MSLLLLLRNASAPRTADLTATLGAATLVAAAVVASPSPPLTANVTATLDAATLAAAGAVAVVGNLTATLGPATLAATVGEPDTGQGTPRQQISQVVSYFNADGTPTIRGLEYFRARERTEVEILARLKALE